MWEFLGEVGEDLWESVGEGVTEVIDSKLGLEVAKTKEQRKDPEVLKAVEPVKAKRTDGSTIVAAKPTTTVLGIDKQTLMVGGGVLTALVLAVTFIVRGK